MSTLQHSLARDSSTLTFFKAWAKQLSDDVRASGVFVNTADTGQVNWASIASVPSSAYVFDMFVFNDALTLYYLKLEYGNVGGANNPAIRFSIGTGTDGAGNLTNSSGTFVLSTTGATPGGSLGTITTFDCRFVYKTGGIAFHWWRNSGFNTSGFFHIERSRDNTGAPTSDYVYATFSMNNGGSGSCKLLSLCWVTGNTGWKQNPTGVSAATGCGGILMGGLTIQSHAFAGSFPISPFHIMKGGWGNPSMLLAGTHYLDVTDGTTYTGTLYGASATYYAAAFESGNSGSGNGMGSFYGNSSTITSAMVRWD
jgi:hypothetical protein